MHCNKPYTARYSKLSNRLAGSVRNKNQKVNCFVLDIENLELRKKECV